MHFDERAHVRDRDPHDDARTLEREHSGARGSIRELFFQRCIERGDVNCAPIRYGRRTDQRSTVRHSADVAADDLHEPNHLDRGKREHCAAIPSAAVRTGRRHAENAGARRLGGDRRERLPARRFRGRPEGRRPESLITQRKSGLARRFEPELRRGDEVRPDRSEKERASRGHLGLVHVADLRGEIIHQCNADAGRSKYCNAQRPIDLDAAVIEANRESPIPRERHMERQGHRRARERDRRHRSSLDEDARGRRIVPGPEHTDLAAKARKIAFVDPEFLARDVGAAGR